MDSNSSPDKAHWLNRYSIGVRTMAMVAAVWIVAAVGFYHTRASDYLDAKIATPLNFYTRDVLGFTPPQDPRLKIFAFDDQAYSKLGTPMLDLDLWGDLLDGFAESKPKAIFVDAMLSAKPTDSAKQLAFYFSRLNTLNVPVVLGSFLSPVRLDFKPPLKVDEPWYQLSHYSPKEASSANRQSDASWTLSKSRENMFAYGPSAELQPWFRKNGHFQLFEENKIEPFLYLGKGTVLPHVSMFAAESVEIQEGHIVVDGKRVALDRHGFSDINFLPPEKLKVRSLLNAINDVKEGYKPAGVSPGDIILILPLYFTGNTDFRPSPYGLVPGGQILAATLNSVLTGKWLQQVLASEVFIVVGIAILAFSLVSLNTFGFWLLCTGLISALFVCAQVAFAKMGLIVPWLLPSIAWLGFAVHLFALKMRFDERKVLILKTALDGAVDPAQMQSMLRRPANVNFEARERILTLMFIDVVGFSLSAENMLPRLAFDTLKEILMEMGRIVHEFGGVVDKTLGDGLLCYFGYRFDSDETTTDHAEQALKAAIRIQELNMEQNIRAVAAGEPLFPLRIGINTSSTYLGDIGSGHRIEFTVVGNGVNFAKRLEGACEMFSILVGSTTWELIKGLEIDKAAVTRKLIHIKHHKELIDAYEYDPMYARKEIRERVGEAFRKSANLQRLNERIPVNDASALILVSEHGPGSVINFSGTGISLQFRTPLTRGAVVRFSLESRIAGLSRALKDFGITTIEAEIRWSYQSAGGHVHGLLFLNITDDQREKFIRTISEYAFIGERSNTSIGEANEAS